MHNENIVGIFQVSIRSKSYPSSNPVKKEIDEPLSERNEAIRSSSLQRDSVIPITDSERILYSPDWREWHVKRETISQDLWTFLTVSVIIVCSPPLPDFLSLSLFLTFSKKILCNQGVGEYRHCLLKFVSLSSLSLSLPVKDNFCLSLSSCSCQTPPRSFSLSVR